MAEAASEPSSATSLASPSRSPGLHLTGATALPKPSVCCATAFTNPALPHAVPPHTTSHSMPAFSLPATALPVACSPDSCFSYLAPVLTQSCCLQGCWPPLVS